MACVLEMEVLVTQWVFRSVRSVVWVLANGSGRRFQILR